MVSLSGGKDSTAMLLRLIEEKRPIDLILFCDTGLEFPQMYDHLKKLEQYIGRKITYLKAEHSFEYYFSEYMPKRKNPDLRQYKGNSWAGPHNRWCTGLLKTRVVQNYLKELKEDFEVVECSQFFRRWCGFKAVYAVILFFFCFCLGIGFPVKGSVHSFSVTAVLNDSCLPSAVLAFEDVFSSSCHDFLPPLF